MLLFSLFFIFLWTGTDWSGRCCSLRRLSGPEAAGVTRTARVHLLAEEGSAQSGHVGGPMMLSERMRSE